MTSGDATKVIRVSMDIYFGLDPFIHMHLHKLHLDLPLPRALLRLICDPDL